MEVAYRTKDQICVELVGFLEEPSKAKPSNRPKKKRPTVDVSPDDKGELDKNRLPQQPLVAIQLVGATPPRINMVLKRIINFLYLDIDQYGHSTDDVVAAVKTSFDGIRLLVPDIRLFHLRATTVATDLFRVHPVVLPRKGYC
jgi:hypothetical protein